MRTSWGGREGVTKGRLMGEFTREGGSEVTERRDLWREEETEGRGVCEDDG